MKNLWKKLPLFSYTTEMFKVVKDTFPEIMKEIFHFYSQNNISLKQEPIIYSSRISLW